METLQEIEETALKLNVEERELLANHLLQSVHSQTINSIDAAWLDEAERRYEEFLKDPSSGISQKTFFSDIRSELEWK